MLTGRVTSRSVASRFAQTTSLTSIQSRVWCPSPNTNGWSGRRDGRTRSPPRWPRRAAPAASRAHFSQQRPPDLTGDAMKLADVSDAEAVADISGAAGPRSRIPSCRLGLALLRPGWSPVVRGWANAVLGASHLWLLTPPNGLPDRFIWTARHGTITASRRREHPVAPRSSYRITRPSPLRTFWSSLASGVSRPPRTP